MGFWTENSKTWHLKVYFLAKVRHVVVGFSPRSGFAVNQHWRPPNAAKARDYVPDLTVGY